MPGLHKWLTAAALALLASGVGGVIAHRSPGAGGMTDGPVPPTTAARPGGAPTTAAAAQASAVPAPPVPAGPAASSAALAAGLITPTDMGGYYRVDGPTAADILDSAPCLAGLSPSSSQVGRAQTALLGPDLHSVPTVVEVVGSYAGQTPASVYREVVAAVESCPSFNLTFGGTPLAVPLKPGHIAPVGLADTTWVGTAPYSGSSLELQLGVVLDGHSVVAMMWIDRVPPSDAIMGDFTSTLSAALGKLA